MSASSEPKIAAAMQMMIVLSMVVLLSSPAHPKIHRGFNILKPFVVAHLLHRHSADETGFPKLQLGDTAIGEFDILASQRSANQSRLWMIAHLSKHRQRRSENQQCDRDL